MSESRKPVEWIGSSRRDIQDLPPEVRREFGRALDDVQRGLTPGNAKRLAGVGGGVLELVEDFRTDTYRAVYTVRFKETLYILHVFQKKSKSGSSTPKPDMDLIRARLKLAEADYQRRNQE